MHARLRIGREVGFTLLVVFMAVGLAALMFLVRLAAPGDGVNLDLRPLSEVYLDSTGELDIESLASDDRSRKFSPMVPGAVPREGLSRTLWLRLPQDLGKLAKGQDAYLEFGSRFPGRITLYTPRAGSTPENPAYDKEIFEGKSFTRRLQPGLAAQPTYVSLNTQGPMILDMNLRSVPVLLRDRGTSMFQSGLVLGSILIFAAVNLLFGMVLKQENQLWYAALILSFGLSMAAHSGLWEHLLGSLSQTQWIVATITSGGLSIALCGMFTRSFLMTRRYAPRADAVILAYSLAALCVGVLAAVLQKPGMGRLLMPLFTLLPFVTTVSGLIRLRQGFSPARLFILGWLLYFTGPLMFISRMEGLLPPGLEPGRITFILSTVVQMFVFLAAMIDRVRTMDRERRALECQQEQSRTVIAAQRGLFRDISHELGSPLSRLYLAHDMILKSVGGDEAPPETSRHLDQMEKDTNRMMELQEQMITMARLQEGQTWRQGEIDLNELAGQVVDQARYEAQAEGADIVLSTGAGAVLRGSPELMRRSLENVVRNAVRHGGSGKDIEVAVARMNGGGPPTARISVRDHGPGVSKDMLPHLFDPFFRVHGGHGAPPGTGLGLAIARQAAGTLGGTIRARNAPGRGLEVVMDFPLKD